MTEKQIRALEKAVEYLKRRNEAEYQRLQSRRECIILLQGEIDRARKENEEDVQ